MTKLQTAYEDLHNALVASPAYHGAVHSVHEAVPSLQASSVYRMAARHLYWTVSPVADPLGGYLAHSSLVAAVVQHLQPLEHAPTAQPAH